MPCPLAEGWPHQVSSFPCSGICSPNIQSLASKPLSSWSILLLVSPMYVPFQLYSLYSHPHSLPPHIHTISTIPHFTHSTIPQPTLLILPPIPKLIHSLINISIPSCHTTSSSYTWHDSLNRKLPFKQHRPTLDFGFTLRCLDIVSFAPICQKSVKNYYDNFTIFYTRYVSKMLIYKTICIKNPCILK